MSVLQTEFPFTLPKGYVDAESGELHREGIMRLATAADELLPLKDPRVQSFEAYHLFILLSRVIVKLGTLEHITPRTIEGLFASDLSYLQDFYNQINGGEEQFEQVTCPHCQKEFEQEVPLLGES